MMNIVRNIGRIGRLNGRTIRGAADDPIGIGREIGLGRDQRILAQLHLGWSLRRRQSRAKCRRSRHITCRRCWFHRHPRRRHRFGSSIGRRGCRIGFSRRWRRQCRAQAIHAFPSDSASNLDASRRVRRRECSAAIDIKHRPAAGVIRPIVVTPPTVKLPPSMRVDTDEFAPLFCRHR